MDHLVDNQVNDALGQIDKKAATNRQINPKYCETMDNAKRGKHGQRLRRRQMEHIETAAVLVIAPSSSF